MNFKQKNATALITIKKEEIWVHELNEHFRGKQSLFETIEKEQKRWVKDFERSIKKMLYTSS